MGTGTELALHSERIFFRLWSEDDIELATILWGDPMVTRWIGGPLSQIEIQERLTREIELASIEGVQYWPIFQRLDGEFLGCCGLRPYRPEAGIYELGIHLLPDHWGKGYASEGARSVITFAFRVLGARAIFAGHHPENTRSAELLNRLGFRYTHHEFYPPTSRDHPSYLLEL